jgi:hypothetical protein
MSSQVFPKFVPIVQNFPRLGLPDVSQSVCAELQRANLDAALRPGSRIAIAVGSRGISNIAEIARATVAYFRAKGLDPIIVPAMGSHGGATPEGQREVLARYRITEQEAGCPVISSLDVISLGTTADGIETCVDATASTCDAIFLINRVKWHTSFEGRVESGLMKMCAIGLGKARGAQMYHVHATRIGMGKVVESVARHVLASSKILGGLAIVEDAYHQPAKVAAIAAAAIEAEEEKLLSLARSWMPRIPFDDVDVLILDEIGKNISGTGMDSKVVNRHPHGNVNLWPWAPKIRRIYVRDLSESTHGNANGLGMADLISERMYQKIDWNSTEVNALTASNLNIIRTPRRAPSDKSALELLARTVGRFEPEEVTYVRLRNTLELARFWASENLVSGKSLPERVSVAGPGVECRFDQDGYLVDVDRTG